MIKQFILLILLLTITSTLSRNVNLPDGIISGVSYETYDAYLSIPFAQPPVGSLRWRSPLPVLPWNGVKNTSTPPPSCPQQGTTYSEDCLYLSVWTPSVQLNQTNLPVMFWIYGGCWTDGSITNPWYNGEYLASNFPGVVVVSANYRVNAFGFLGSQSLAQESNIGSTGNYGLQDQRLAMKWIRNNIKYFGGNPSNVMAFGQSAGSGSLACHLVMPLSSNLIDGAILESGPFVNWISRPLSVAYNQFDQYAKTLGCTGNPDAVLACMRGKSAADLLNNQPSCSATCCWAPTVDGAELSDSPQRLAESLKFTSKIPVIVGTTADEDSIFLQLPKNTSAETYQELVMQTFAPFGAAILQLYPASNFTLPWFAASEIYRDASWLCPARRSVRWLSQAGMSTYLYWWTHVIEATKIDPFLGAFHGVEIPFVFNLPSGWDLAGYKITWAPDEEVLQKNVVDLWKNFATSGNPNGGDRVPYWPEYDVKTDLNINFDTEITIDTHLNAERCDLWDKIYESQNKIEL